MEYSLICLVASFGLQLEFMLERILKAFRISTLVSFTMMLSGFIGFQLFAENLIRIFGDSPETLSIGPTALRRLSLCFLMASFAIPIESVFQSVGNGTRSMTISVSRQIAILIPFIWILGNLFGLDALWYAFFLSDVVGIIMSAFFYKKIYKEKFADL